MPDPMARRKSFTKKIRALACRRYAAIVHEVAGARRPHIKQDSIFPQEMSCATSTVSTCHGGAKTSFDIGPAFAHIYFQFDERPGHLPTGPSLNPHSFKWNDFETPRDDPQGRIDHLLDDFERRLRAICEQEN